MSLTPTQQSTELARLERKAKAARDAQAKADAKLQERDDKAADLADAGLRYQDIASAIGITVDGVTYILRKVRKRRAQTTA